MEVALHIESRFLSKWEDLGNEDLNLSTEEVIVCSGESFDELVESTEQNKRHCFLGETLAQGLSLLME